MSQQSEAQTIAYASSPIICNRSGSRDGDEPHLPIDVMYVTLEASL